MSIVTGSTAPDFEADTTQGSIRFHDRIGDDEAADPIPQGRGTLRLHPRLTDVG